MWPGARELDTEHVKKILDKLMLDAVQASCYQEGIYQGTLHALGKYMYTTSKDMLRRTHNYLLQDCAKEERRIKRNKTQSSSYARGYILGIQRVVEKLQEVIPNDSPQI